MQEFINGEGKAILFLNPISLQVNDICFTLQCIQTSEKNIINKIHSNGTITKEERKIYKVKPSKRQTTGTDIHIHTATKLIDQLKNNCVKSSSKEIFKWRRSRDVLE